MRRRSAWLILPLPLFILAGCGDETAGLSSGSGSGSGGGAAGPLEIPIAADPQRPGDPEKGYTALVNAGYVSCGVPNTAFAKVFGPALPEFQIPGRTPENASLEYDLTRFVTTDGVDVVSANCLHCHAGFIKGKLVIGLGDTQGDYTSNNAGEQAGLAQIFLTDQKEKDELTKFKGRLDAITDYTNTMVVGVNPADNLAAVLFAHRDRIPTVVASTQG